MSGLVCGVLCVARFIGPFFFPPENMNTQMFNTFPVMKDQCHKQLEYTIQRCISVVCDVE